MRHGMGGAEAEAARPPPVSRRTHAPPILFSIQCLGAFNRFRCFPGPRAMVVGGVGCGKKEGGGRA